MTKKQRAAAIIGRLKTEYPDVDCTLEYDQAWKLLVSVRLAAQCTDARVNVVVQDLYAKYPDVNALADAPVEKIEKIVHPCGLGPSKARDISACMKRLRDDFGGIGRYEIRGMFGDRPFAGGGIARAAETPDAGHAVERESEGRAEEAEADDRDVRHAGTVIRCHSG